MGWLGYTEQETLDTSMPALIRGYDGKVKMLRACYGGTDDTPEATATVAVTEPPPAPVFADQVRGALRALAG